MNIYKDGTKKIWGGHSNSCRNILQRNKKNKAMTTSNNLSFDVHINNEYIDEFDNISVIENQRIEETEEEDSYEYDDARYKCIKDIAYENQKKLELKYKLYRERENLPSDNVKPFLKAPNKLTKEQKDRLHKSVIAAFKNLKLKFSDDLIYADKKAPYVEMFKGEKMDSLISLDIIVYFSSKKEMIYCNYAPLEIVLTSSRLCC